MELLEFVFYGLTCYFVFLEDVPEDHVVLNKDVPHLELVDVEVVDCLVSFCHDQFLKSGVLL